MDQVSPSFHDFSISLELKDLILSARYQPIVNLSNATILGYEGLIRGPKGRHHEPLVLLAEAKEHGILNELEQLSAKTILDTFSRKRNLNKLFININPECLVDRKSSTVLTQENIYNLGLDPHNIVIELTESSPTFDFKLLRKATEFYRNKGFEFAMDDLGEGFSSLRLWSELEPEYVKIDKHFIHHINLDPLKLEFAKSIQQIAENSGAQVIAEGVETEAELNVIRSLNIAYGQGYFFGKPEIEPLIQIDENLKSIIAKSRVNLVLTQRNYLRSKDNLIKLVRYSPPISPDTINDEVFHTFQSNPNLNAIAVVEGKKPIGLVSRYTMIDSFSKPYSRELFGKKTCDFFMDKNPLIVEKDMAIHELSDLITNMEPYHLSNGFIVTNDGDYLGLGNGHDLLRQVTQMQIKAARYANPLTLLPGNVPINEHIDHLLKQKIEFWACYCDLDNFKPFNDAYGFGRGDDLIKYVGNLLTSVTSADIDFVGHIGGDDFIIVFQSDNWEHRCKKILAELELAMPTFYDPDDAARRSIEAIDRQGEKLKYPIGSISIGVVNVNNTDFSSHYEVVGAISRAKKQAKQISGNSIFLERRTGKFSTAS
ncbi:MAG: GGDEF domain-containing protein [Methylophilaceae bacterium]